jgi:hypothetical protein
MIHNFSGYHLRARKVAGKKGRAVYEIQVLERVFKPPGSPAR